MIRLPSSQALFARFTRDLLAQSPRALDVPPPELSRYAHEDVAAARVAWAQRVVDEYRSVVVFSELLRALGEAEAPFDALTAIHRLIGDELRHTHLCIEAVQALGGLDGIEIDLSEVGLPPSELPPSVRALEIIVRELVVAEAESVDVFRAYRGAVTDPYFRRVIEIILMDEVRHAAAGRSLASHLADVWSSERTRAALDKLAAVARDDQRELRAGYLSGAQGGPGRALGACIEPRDLVWSDRSPVVW